MATAVRALLMDLNLRVSCDINLQSRQSRQAAFSSIAALWRELGLFGVCYGADLDCSRERCWTIGSDQRYAQKC